MRRCNMQWFRPILDHMPYLNKVPIRRDPLVVAPNGSLLKYEKNRVPMAA